jgi:hypothetical protein
MNRLPPINWYGLLFVSICPSIVSLSWKTGFGFHGSPPSSSPSITARNLFRKPLEWVGSGVCVLAGGSVPFHWAAYMWTAIPICRIRAPQSTALAAWRARWRLGSRIEISSAMIPMTTSSSTSVKP